MSNHITHTNEAHKTTSLEEGVLARLSSEKISPRPWWQFYVREGAVWLLWCVSVLVGAAAVAVTLYVTLSVPFMFYEVTHESLVVALVYMLPWLWLVIFLGMAYLAWVNLRHTRRGYRYHALTLVTSSVVMSVGLGLLMHQFGHGYAVDRTVATWVNTYPSHEKMRLTVWQAPSEGRLVGTVVANEQPILIDHASGTIVFQDSAGAQWQLSIAELSSRGQSLLARESLGRLRLLGTTTAPHEFYVCGVYDWAFAAEYDSYAKQQMDERDAFIKTVASYQTPAGIATATAVTRCASLPAFKRMPDMHR